MYFQGGLDPSKVHKITLTDDGYEVDQSTISLNSITVFGSHSSAISGTPNGGGSTGSHPVSTGVIAGAAVAATLLLVAFVTSLFLYLKRRRQNSDQYPSRGDRDPHGIDEPGDESPQGFISEPYQPPIGYVTRPSKGSSLAAQPNVTRVGKFYQQQQQTGSQTYGSNETGASRSVPGQDEVEHSERRQVAPVNNQTPILDYDLLAEHVVARITRAEDGGELNPPEYMPPGLNRG